MCYMGTEEVINQLVMCNFSSPHPDSEPWSEGESSWSPPDYLFLLLLFLLGPDIATHALFGSGFQCSRFHRLCGHDSVVQGEERELTIIQCVNISCVSFWLNSPKTSNNWFSFLGVFWCMALNSTVIKMHKNHLSIKQRGWYCDIFCWNFLWINLGRRFLSLFTKSVFSDIHTRILKHIIPCATNYLSA